MKTFTKQEVRDLLNKVIMDEISFTRMVEIMNERMSERANERVSERVNIPEKTKKGDLAIFWEEKKKFATIRIYDRPNGKGAYFQHKDNIGSNWKNAIKFESKEQYERLIKGEI